MRVSMGTRRRFVAGALGLIAGAALAAGALPVAGQGEQRVVSGVVEQKQGNNLIVATNTAAVTVQTGPNTRYEKEGEGTIYDLQPGQLVGVTGQPSADGQMYAVQVRIFPAALNPSLGQRAMAGSQLGNLMTNATVTSFADDQLVLSAAGSTYTIRTSPDTTVLMPVPATANDVQEGNRIAATGTMGPNDLFQASLINVLGPPPEMLPAGPAS